MESAIPGRLMPLCSPSMPPLSTSQRTSLPRTAAHAQLDQAVAEQDAGAGAELAGKVGEGRGDAGRVAREHLCGVMVTTEPVFSRTGS